jgi:hypothetical protein
MNAKKIAPFQFSAEIMAEDKIRCEQRAEAIKAAEKCNDDLSKSGFHAEGLIASSRACLRISRANNYCVVCEQRKRMEISEK